jgi:hypothetical protein
MQELLGDGEAGCLMRLTHRGGDGALQAIYRHGGRGKDTPCNVRFWPLSAR